MKIYPFMKINGLAPIHCASLFLNINVYINSSINGQAQLQKMRRPILTNKWACLRISVYMG